MRTIVLRFGILITIFVMINPSNGNFIGITQENQDLSSNQIHLDIELTDQSYAIYGNVDASETGINFSYHLQNNDDEPITAFYLLHDAANLIDLALVNTPLGWVFEVMPPVIMHGDDWTYIAWYLNPSGDPSLGILPGEILSFSYTFDAEMENYQIADGIWSISSVIGAENFYQDPLLGQIGNSTEFDGDINSYANGLSEVPTIVKAAEICVIGNNSFPTTYETNHSIPIEFSSQLENYSKHIETHDYEQGWSPAGNWGCFPTAVGYSLSWWGKHGVAPVEESGSNNRSLALNLSINPLNVTDFDSMNDLVEELSEAMKANAMNGTSLKKAVEGIDKFIKDNNLPLNYTHYDMGKFLANSSGNPNPDNIIDEFMNKREDVTLVLAYRGAAHAVTLVGMNRTLDPNCGYKITILDPADGKEIETCLKAQYFDEDNSKWTEDETGEKYGKVYYKGRWRGITGSIAISPSNPAAIVDGSTGESFVSQKLVLKQDKTKFTYFVAPVPGQGALIDTFAIDTQVKDKSLLSDFDFPNGWMVSMMKNQHDTLRIYFHNNLYNGANAAHLSSTTEFSFSFTGTDSSVSNWYTTHTGQAHLDTGLEDTGFIFVPEETEDTTTSTITSTGMTYETTTSIITTPTDVRTNESSLETTSSEDNQTSTGSLHLKLLVWIVAIPIMMKSNKMKSRLN